MLSPHQLATQAAEAMREDAAAYAEEGCRPCCRVTSDRAPADYAFLFDDGGMGVEADTLADALRRRPDLSAAQLETVVCLHTTNIVWGFVGDAPWVDRDPASHFNRC